MKIVLIGAGSAVFSLSMIKDICLTPGLAGAEVCLVDISPERLEAAYSLCCRYAAELGAPLMIGKTSERMEALPGADFVINTALACGHTKMQDGLRTAERFGYHYGGSLHIMHDEGFWINFYQLRMIEEVYVDTRRCAPDAWYILVANPVLAATTLLGRKYHDPRVVGLCEGPGAIHEVFRELGFDEKDVRYELAGTNHFIWMTKLFYKGQDAFPLLDEWIRVHRDDPVSTRYHLCPKVVDMYQTFGAIPIGDTHSAGGGSYGWWYHSDPETERAFQEDPPAIWEDYYAACAKNVRDIERYAADPSIRLTEVYPPVHSKELIIDLVESLACDVERKMVVNLFNDVGYVPGIPADFSVEIEAICNAGGIRGIHTGPLPRAVLGHFLADRAGMIEVELAAHTQRDERLLVDLVQMDHQTKSRAQAQALVDAILALPWNSDMREHYRGAGARRSKWG